MYIKNVKKNETKKQQKEKYVYKKCNMVMMAEGAESNICSQPYPKFRDWKMQRKVNRTKEIVT